MPAVDQILADGTYLHVEGAGRPLVLIHGVGMDLTMWTTLAARLIEDFRVIRYDMIGHGRSPKPVGPYQLKDYVDQLMRLADALQLRRFDLLGFSMGGLVAQAFAARHGDLLDRLFLLNTVYRRSEEERAAIARRVADVATGGYPASVDAAIERWFTPNFRRDNADIVEDIRQHMLGNDLAAYAAAYRVFATADAELADSAATITTPTLVITGSDDRRSTVAMAEALAAAMPRARASIIPGQRHLTPIECPGEIAACIHGYMAPANAEQGRLQHG